MTFKELRRESGMTQQRFADFFGIPKRTIEDWDRGARECAPYLLDLMKYKLENEGFIREKDYVRIPTKAIDTKRSPEERRAHIKKLVKIQEKIARKAADAEANAMTLEIKKHLDK